MTEVGEPDGWRASLVIATNALGSAHLVEAIGVEPDRAWDRGQEGAAAGGRSRQRYSGVSYWSTLTDATDVQHHLDNLLDRLAPCKARIAALVADLATKPGAAVSVGVRLVVPTNSDAQGLHFSKCQLREIADLGADLGITVEFWGRAREPGERSVAVSE